VGLFLALARGFFAFQSVLTGSGAHPPFYSVCSEGPFSRGKAPRTWSWTLSSVWCPYLFVACTDSNLHLP